VTTFYQVWTRADDAGQVYWVSAESEKQARRLVALNAGDEAREAEDARKFGCRPSTEKMPPPGVIYTRLNGIFSIEKWR